MKWVYAKLKFASVIYGHSFWNRLTECLKRYAVHVKLFFFEPPTNKTVTARSDCACPFPAKVFKAFNSGKESFNQRNCFSWHVKTPIRPAKVKPAERLPQSQDGLVNEFLSFLGRFKAASILPQAI